MVIASESLQTTLCYCVFANDIAPYLDFKLSDDIPDANDESHRRVERGSKIILATQAKSSLVLQVGGGKSQATRVQVTHPSCLS